MTNLSQRAAERIQERRAFAKGRRLPALRVGVPAHIEAPERKKAAVSCKEWLGGKRGGHSA